MTEFIQLSFHVRIRWLQRAGIEEERVHEVLDRCPPVGAPDHAGKARLHAPSDTVICIRDGVATTVLNAENEPLNTDHLKTCPDCENLYQPGDGGCTWCLDE